MLTIGFEACTPPENGNVEIETGNGCMGHILSHIGDTGVPPGGQKHAELRIVPAEGGFALRFALGNADVGAGIVGAAS